MKSPANITSTDAVRRFRTAMQQYEADLRDIVAQLILECRRGLEYVEHDRARYWPREAREAADALAQARNDLERCEMALRADDRRSCYEQKIAVQAAKARLRTAEAKVRAVRKWRVEAKHEADHFQGQLNKLSNYLDGEFPRALAALERMARALDRYTEATPPTKAGGATAGSEEGS
jgi:hypothetical protein